MRSNLLKNGFETPTPVQAESIPPALSGSDIVATAQTGTGKTLGFLIPMMEALLNEANATGVRAVILSPTRELAIQINETFLKLSVGTKLRSAVVVGGLPEANQLRSIRKGAQVLVATPGRLCDFMGRRLVALGNVRFVVLDEADRMLDMGFLPSIREILKDTPDTRQTLLFSATIEKSVARLIDSHVRNPVRISIGSAAKPAENVSLHVYEVEQDRKVHLLCRLLDQEKGTFLVFARTKHGADRLAKRLSGEGVRAARIHGGRTQSQRNEALRGFKCGDFRVLVATDVAARGLHVDNIGHVVNFDLPQVPEDFIHRVGRTGRAGLRGISSTFSTRSERGEIRRIERALSLRLTPRAIASDARALAG
ncbi:MAG: DEAD/DEAH box helicase [Bryobacteraceae bacterium]|nr:DEAD/DEAH box helicase [Bryobacteraceae bacterium]